MAQLGLIAGAGELPRLAAQHAWRQGQRLPAVALSPPIAEALAPYCAPVLQYHPGELGKILQALRRCGVQQVVMAGTVPKAPLWQAPRLDLRALRVLRRARAYRDMTLWQALSAEFAREGLEVVEQTRLLGHLLAPEGVLTPRHPTRREWEDIRYGFAQAKRLASLDIGQTVVVYRGTVLAVEAVEGTDAAIARGCRYGRRGTVVVKVARQHQDMRFDVPAVGPDTLRTLAAGHGSVLAVEAGKVFMLHREELLATARAQRIALVGVAAAPMPRGEEA